MSQFYSDRTVVCSLSTNMTTSVQKDGRASNISWQKRMSPRKAWVGVMAWVRGSNQGEKRRPGQREGARGMTTQGRGVAEGGGGYGLCSRAFQETFEVVNCFHTLGPASRVQSSVLLYSFISSCGFFAGSVKSSQSLEDITRKCCAEAQLYQNSEVVRTLVVLRLWILLFLSRLL